MKNFITIKEHLEKYSARSLRLFVLLHRWDHVINFSETSMQEALNKDIRYKEFYSNIRVALRTNPLKNC